MPKSKTLGGVVDALYLLREKRLVLSRQADAIGDEERVMRQDLLRMLSDAGTSTARGQIANASRYLKSLAVVADPKKFIQHVVKTNAWELVQIGARLESCRERWEQGKAVPGVVSDAVVQLSLTKAPAKKR